jgi:hypothetical protein
MTAGGEPLAKPGPELALKNRKLSAEKWPAGALETCEKIEAEHPGWWAFWRDANTIKGFEHPASFAAHHQGRHVTVCGVDAAALSVAIEQAPEQRHWHYENVCCGPRLKG